MVYTGLTLTYCVGGQNVIVSRCIYVYCLPILSVSHNSIIKLTGSVVVSLSAALVIMHVTGCMYHKVLSRVVVYMYCPVIYTSTTMWCMQVDLHFYHERDAE